MMLKIMEVISNEPKLAQKQIFKQLAYSNSTIKRYTDDIQKGSRYKSNK